MLGKERKKERKKERIVRCLEKKERKNCEMLGKERKKERIVRCLEKKERKKEL